MKKQILLLMIMFATGLLFVTVTKAAELQYGFTSHNFADNEAIEREVTLEKGWNLVHGFGNPAWIVGSDVKSKDIKAIYFLNPVNKQYVRMYPSPIRKEVDNLTSVTEMVSLVYSKKSGIVKFKTQKSDILRFTWPAGLNMIGITDSFVGKSLNQLKGNCVISDYYIWQKENKSWGKGDFSFDTSFGSDSVGKGILLKLEKSCKLGS